MKGAAFSSRPRAPGPPIAPANSAVRSDSNCSPRARPRSLNAAGRGDVFLPLSAWGRGAPRKGGAGEGLPPHCKNPSPGSHLTMLATHSHKGRGEERSSSLSLIRPHPLHHLLDMPDRGFRLDAVAEVEDQPPAGVIRKHVVDP